MLTKPHLRRLRNEIEMTMFIADILRLEHRWCDNRFRFLCPLCNEFNTAVNPKTNLGRCFRCKRNFNPIDLVMLIKRLAFMDAVAFLEPYLPE